MERTWIAALAAWVILILMAGQASGAGPAGERHKHHKVSHAANPQAGYEKGAEDVICFRPIGFFRAPDNQRGTTPRQGAMAPESRASIVVEPLYRNALQGLERFQYIIVLYYFDRIINWTDTVRPPWARDSFGLFATRTPRRPNPIGMTVVKLDSMDMETGILNISGVDAFDNTPVLDIKPYLPALDCIDTTIETGTVPEELRTRQ